MAANLDGVAGAAFPNEAISQQPVTLTSAALVDASISPAVEADVLSISVARLPASWVVSLQGELDVSGVGLLERKLAETDGAPLDTVVDLRRLEFLDCSGLRGLVSAQMKLADAGRRFFLVRGPAQIQRLMALTHAEARFDFLDGAVLA